MPAIKSTLELPKSERRGRNALQEKRAIVLLSPNSRDELRNFLQLNGGWSKLCETRCFLLVELIRDIDCCGLIDGNFM